MQDRFDPYQQWLGISAADQPPDHYRLLGLPPFTDDREAISRVARARIGQVRLADAGRQPELAERLVAELTLAWQTLLDPPKKLTYDAILRGVRVSTAGGRPESSRTWAERPPVGPTAPGVAAGANGYACSKPDMAGAADGSGTVSPGGHAGWMTPRTALLLGIAGVLAAAIVLGLHLSLESRRDANRDPFSRRDGLLSEDSALPGPTTTASAAALVGKSPVSNAAGSIAPSDVAAGPPTAEVARLLTAARRAMFDRDLDTAGQDIDRATRAARTDSDRAAAERVSKLLHSLDKFWQAARDGCRQLQSGEELEIADTRAIVVGVDASGITIRAAGRNLDYAFHELPRPLAVLAAQRRLSQDPQVMDLHIGSFLAVDRRGDRQEARRRWEKAGADGQSLMPEITLAPPVETIKPDVTAHQ